MRKRESDVETVRGARAKKTLFLYKETLKSNLSVNESRDNQVKKQPAMLFRSERILNAAQLRKLSEHKYAVTSSSLIEPYLQVKNVTAMTFEI
jgi:hypothetical protein